MKTAQWKWDQAHGWAPSLPIDTGLSPQLVLIFGAPSTLANPALLGSIARAFPQARMLGCSTAGEICGTQVSDETLVVTAVHFERTRISCGAVNWSELPDSCRAGELLAERLPPTLPAEQEGAADDPLAHVLVLSDGLYVNGSDLVRGLTKRLPKGVTVTGGLAGDGDRFGETLVLWEGGPRKKTIVALGLYGRSLKVGFGSLGGWDPFGPERLITKSQGNVLHELDGRSALELYKRYLGEHARDLPAAGLLFPLSVRAKTGERAVVRSMLSLDEKNQSMIFAGDVPEGAYAQMMKANYDRLIDGATGAATVCHQAADSVAPQLAILISCVGRKFVLKQRVEEEVEGVRRVFGSRTTLAGFYSYGEICPFAPGAPCELHNQTMTITTLLES